MQERPPLTIDMTPAGEFRPAPGGVAWPTKLAVAAVGVSLVTGLVAIAALMLYVAVLLVPVAIGAALIAWLAFRFSRWRGGAGRPLARR